MLNRVAFAAGRDVGVRRRIGRRLPIRRLRLMRDRMTDHPYSFNK